MKAIQTPGLYKAFTINVDEKTLLLDLIHRALACPSYVLLTKERLTLIGMLSTLEGGGHNLKTEIKLYTTEVCPKCRKLKTFLQAQGITFQVIDMQSPEGQTELKFNGIFTLEAPVLQVGEEFYLSKQLFKGNELSEETKSRLMMG
ncbi:glutaredoxin family protein [Methanosarcina sp. UBA289]|uniref:glutaredoxin family protein n=1 Tax=Methanosarcina sp. UBA289 TaxID=1915574 RepID=UPI0025F226F6|nr:glutaredoxin family protein [Methanosarcina sp. UBA289]